jgi:acyl-ACP thioesterase
MPLFRPFPGNGRVFTAEYRVRLGDSSPTGRVRFDALARFLQDVAEDDANDAGWPKSIGWLLRRCSIEVRQFPVLGERVRFETFCSASAPRWAERTTTMTGHAGGSVQASAVWISVDAASGRPTRLGELFERVYAPSAEGRRASARLSLPPPSTEALAKARNWQLRSSDLDVWGHVNNAISWAAIEDELSLSEWLPQRAEVEYNDAIAPGDTVRLARESSDRGLAVWLASAGGVVTSARLHQRAGQVAEDQAPTGLPAGNDAP